MCLAPLRIDLMSRACHSNLEKYCTKWHSLNQMTGTFETNVTLHTTFERQAHHIKRVERLEVGVSSPPFPSCPHEIGHI